MDGTGGSFAIGDTDRVLTDEDRRRAFGRLIDDGLERSFRLARLILRTDADAEDAVQDAVVAAWRNWQQLEDVNKFDAWFARILVNRCRDRLRSMERTRTTDLSNELHGSSREFEQAEGRIDLGRAFEALNPDQRVAVVLRYWSDLSLEEIARRTSVPEGTVKSRLHHALERLRAELDRAEATT
jgi:RNA polymerase sigma-70 factor (ECF subfamily)